MILTKMLILSNFNNIVYFNFNKQYWKFMRQHFGDICKMMLIFQMFIFYRNEIDTACI